VDFQEGNLMTVGIYSTLKGIENIDPDHTTSIVIDVFRASTTIICLMERGLNELKVVASVEEAITLKDIGFIPIGERGPKPLPGFEFDNSPSLVSDLDWSDKKVVLTTSNGTRALVAVQDCKEVVVAGFRNIDAVADCVRNINDHIAIVPIGHMGDQRIEDELCADALKKRVQNIPVDWPGLTKNIWNERSSIMSANNPTYEKDLELGLMVNTTSIIPELISGLYLKKK
jgi:2-phosphosulfolactate phosphatase